MNSGRIWQKGSKVQNSDTDHQYLTPDSGRAWICEYQSQL